LTIDSIDNYAITPFGFPMLYQLFQTTLSEQEFNELLQLTFTENERAMMLERWRIFEAFDRGCSQREVAREVPCSIVTATRGAKVYREHKDGVKKHLERWRGEKAPTT
jgi:Trp operon repressor